MSLRSPSSLVQRTAAAEATIVRFAGKPLVWGREDCLRLVSHALRELGFTPPLREAGVYRSHLGAHKALKRMGCNTLTEWVDRWGLSRIPPAGALTADVLAFATDDPKLPALALQLTNNRVLGFAPDAGVAAVVANTTGTVPLAAWRV